MINAPEPASRAPLMSSHDVVLIQQLNARYAHALDGLVPDAGQAWAETFTEDGRVSVVAADGQTKAEATGRAKIALLWHSFPDVAVTRHWFNNLAVEVDGTSARTRAYIVAMLVNASPAVIVRTGLYQDRLSKIAGAWLFDERVLTLDPTNQA
jgi:hypothetical protein